MTDQAENRMNLTVIKRVDPYAKEIVDTSAHVAYYAFNSDDQEWEKTDVEGAFFIYSRNGKPYHNIFINNRLNTTALVEPITDSIELQTQSPFLLYRNEKGLIRGFWFYNKSECERIGDLLGRLVKESDVVPQTKTNLVTPQKGQDVSQPGNNIDIFTMLSRAQENYNQGSPGVVKMHPHGMNNNINVLNNNMKGIAPPAGDLASESVMNFFAAAKPAAAKEVPLFDKLFQNKNPLSVEQLEKQQRATTPQEAGNSCQSPHTQNQNQQQQQRQKSKPVQIQKNNNRKQVIDNRVGFMRINSPNHQEPEASPLAAFLNVNNLTGVPIHNNNVQPNPTVLSDIESRQQQHQQQPLQHMLQQSTEQLNGMSLSSTPGKPALMPPTMFISKTPKGTKDTLSSGVPGILTMEKPSAMKPIPSVPEPLTQSQLLQAMNYLIKNDPEFVKKLHEAYLKSFKEMVSV